MRPSTESPSIRGGLLAVGLALLLGSTVLGCDQLGSTDGTVITTTVVVGETTSSEVFATTTDTVADTTTTAPAVSTPTTLASTEERLSNGHIKSMGYIEDVWVDGTGRHLSIDYCSFVSGGVDAMTAAARRDGVIGATEVWEFEFYIENVNSRLREWDVSNSVVITTSTRWVGGDMDMGAPCSWEDFLSFWGPGPFPESEGHLHEVPWWIERDGDTVVKIDEQYLP